MVKPAYYNEFDKYAAAWIRNLIAQGLIAPGDVDERDIRDVHPDDLRGYSQVHLFAGIGVWSYALRRAGWPDDRQIWTASCPCQPFSAAGAGEGFADERHLWPHVFYLIQKRHPAIVVGEQVASKDADSWLDLVQDDMEALGVAFGAIAFPAAGVGAPHIRDRTYWVGDSRSSGLERHAGHDGLARWQGASRPAASTSVPHGLADDDIYRRAAAAFAELHDAKPDPESRCGVGRLADAGSERVLAARRRAALAAPYGAGQQAWEQRLRPDSGTGCAVVGGMADDPCGGRGEERPNAGGISPGNRAEGITARPLHGGGDSRPGPTNGLWRDADWLLCRDGKWRPVEPGTFPLADGIASRVGRLRAYGNAINAIAAEAFISCLM